MGTFLDDLDDHEGYADRRLPDGQLAGGLYGTEGVAESISGYDSSMLISVLVYLIPTLFLLRKKKLEEVRLYSGRR